MYADTVADAVAQVWSVIRSVNSAQVLDYVPPPGNVKSPCVIVDRNGLSYAEDTYRVPVRVYVAASRHGGVRDAQHVLDETIDAIEGALADASVQTNGRIAYVDASDVWLADLVAVVSRV